MARFLNAVLAGGVVLAAATSAHASIITQTFTQPTTNGSFTQSFTANGFDTTLGTLNSITFTLTSDITTIAQVTNISGNATPFTNDNAAVPVTLTGPAGYSLFVTGTAGPFAGNVPSNSTITAGTNSATYTNTSTVSPGSFATYEGPGASTFSIGLIAGNVQASGNGVNGADFFGGTNSSDATITLTYDYSVTPPATVPEPASMALLGAGLLGVALIRRKRA